MRSYTVLFLTLAFAWASAGCTAPQPTEPPPPPPLPTVPEPTPQPAAPAEPATMQPATEHSADPGAVIAADIEGYLEEVAATAAELETYTMAFTRVERKRRGFGYQLGDPEYVDAWVRREPFSVKLKWRNEDLKYDESVYVTGAHDNMVRFVTRFPVFLLKPPPEINRIDTVTPVLIGETKRPITDFGLENTIRRTLESIDADRDEVTMTYLGIVDAPESGVRAHHIRLTYPRPANKPSLQDLFIDAATNLPVGSELRLADETLDGGYYYAEIDPNAGLTDEDFLLSVERDPPTTHPANDLDQTP
jgi:hypothetical protein